MRLKSLDALRGLTVAAMLLVNLPGDRNHVYRLIDHADWHGCTLADLVFPFFLFIVGITTELTLRARRLKGVADSELRTQILRRGAIIFGLGLFLFVFPFFPVTRFTEIRIPGVLQRIAVTYMIGAFLMLKTSFRQQLAVGAGILLGYWAVTSLYPIDVPDQTLAARIDRYLLPGHLWPVTKTWDPEGILSTFPAVVTVLIGGWSARWISRVEILLERRINRLMTVGAALAACGWLWGLVFPINKALWTSSYVLFTGGLALMALGICTWLVDVKKADAWCEPFLAFGMNPIAAYVGTTMFARLIYTVITFEAPEGRVSVQSAFYSRTFAQWLSPENASLAFGLAVLFLWYLILNELRRRRIFFKV